MNNIGFVSAAFMFRYSCDHPRYGEFVNFLFWGKTPLISFFSYRNRPDKHPCFGIPEKWDSGPKVVSGTQDPGAGA